MTKPRETLEGDTFYDPSTCPKHGIDLRITRDKDDGSLIGLCPSGCRISPIFDIYDHKSFIVFSQRVRSLMVEHGKSNKPNEQKLREMFTKGYSSSDALEEL